MTTIPAAPELQRMTLVLVLGSVAGSTAACKAHGDLPTARVLASYYALAADAARSAGGRIVKVIGDGVLATFPTERAQDAMLALRIFQRVGTRLWQEFDPACRVQVRVGSGSVVAGAMGPPEDPRFDVYGDALNQLFRMAAGDVVVSDEAQALLS
jgi:adenylate cyclase